MRRVAAAALAVAAVVFGAPSGATAVAAAGAAPDAADACDLLRRAEISAVLVQPAGSADRELGPNFCRWDLDGTDARAAGQVNTLLQRGKRAVRDFGIVSRLGDAIPVLGVGKRAVYIPTTGTLFVLAGDRTLYYVQALVYAPDATRLTDGIRDLVVDLATRAEARVR